MLFGVSYSAFPAFGMLVRRLFLLAPVLFLIVALCFLEMSLPTMCYVRGCVVLRVRARSLDIPA